MSLVCLRKNKNILKMATQELNLCWKNMVEQERIENRRKEILEATEWLRMEYERELKQTGTTLTENDD